MAWLDEEGVEFKLSAKVKSLSLLDLGPLNLVILSCGRVVESDFIVSHSPNLLHAFEFKIDQFQNTH